MPYRERLCEALALRGLRITKAVDGTEAVLLARRSRPQLALVELCLPGVGGLELVRQLRALDSPVKVVVLSRFLSVPLALDAVRLGAIHCLSKPASIEEILAGFEPAGFAAEVGATPGLPLPSLACVEREYINRVLHYCGGNVSRAARVLDVHRRSLQRKLTKYPPRR